MVDRASSPSARHHPSALVEASPRSQSNWLAAACTVDRPIAHRAQHDDRAFRLSARPHGGTPSGGGAARVGREARIEDCSLLPSFQSLSFTAQDASLGTVPRETSYCDERNLLSGSEFWAFVRRNGLLTTPPSSRMCGVWVMRSCARRSQRAFGACALKTPN